MNKICYWNKSVQEQKRFALMCIKRSEEQHKYVSQAEEHEEAELMRYYYVHQDGQLNKHTELECSTNKEEISGETGMRALTDVTSGSSTAIVMKKEHCQALVDVRQMFKGYATMKKNMITLTLF